MERQQTFGLCLLEHSVADIRVDHEYLAYLVALEHVEQDIGYLTGAVHRRILRRVEEAPLHRYAVVREVLPSVLADYEKLRGGVFLQQLLSLAYNVLVVHSGKSLVCGNYQAGVRIRQRVAAVLGIEPAALRVLLRGTEDTLYLALYRLEVGAGVIQLRLCLAHFR